MKVEEIKNKTKDAVEYLVKSLEAGHTEVLTQYLAAMGRFHTYSFGNICLIARQRPSATNVAGVRAWNSLGRVVKKGEKGIMILAPMIGYRQRRQEETVAGETATEERKQHLIGFRSVWVFDTIIS